MILRLFTSSAAFALAALGALPAHADVLEIAVGGEARWVSGPQVPAAWAAPQPPQFSAAAQAPAQPLVQFPPELTALVPEAAIVDAASQAGIVPAVYANRVMELAVRFDLSPALIEALVWQESRWRADAVSPVGARGLAQLMPGTARELGVDPNDPFANLEGGARYLRQQLDRFDGDLERALAAYNAGPGRVIRAGGVPRIRETQQYVAAIMGRLASHSRSPN